MRRGTHINTKRKVPPLHAAQPLKSTAGLASMRLEITEISPDTPQSKASRGLHGLAE